MNPNQLFSEDLPFQQMIRKFEEHFPQLTDSMLIVVDGDAPEAVRDAADALAARLRARRGRLHRRLLPGRGVVLREARTALPERRRARRVHRAAGAAPADHRRAGPGPEPVEPGLGDPDRARAAAHGSGGGRAAALGAGLLPRGDAGGLRRVPAVRVLGAGAAGRHALRPGDAARDRRRSGAPLRPHPGGGTGHGRRPRGGGRAGSARRAGAHHRLPGAQPRGVHGAGAGHDARRGALVPARRARAGGRLPLLADGAGGRRHAGGGLRLDRLLRGAGRGRAEPGLHRLRGAVHRAGRRLHDPPGHARVPRGASGRGGSRRAGRRDPRHRRRRCCCARSPPRSASSPSCPPRTRACRSSA